jgi:endo-1,3-1,4-beta-glycanase ExoK
MLLMRTRHETKLLCLVACAPLLALLGCGSGGAPAGPRVVMSVSPTSALLASGDTVQFIATTNEPEAAEVRWSVNGVAGGNSTAGTITPAGFYTAPALQPSGDPVTVTATSIQNPAVKASASVSISSPVPQLNSVSPTVVGVGTSFSLTVDGADFVPGSVVRWNGNDCPTTFDSPARLFASIPAEDTSVAGTVPVTVSNPPPGGGTSNSADFMVDGGWEDNFDGSVIDESRWQIANEVAPQSVPGEHASFYRADHATVSGGYLSLVLTQENGTVGDNPNAIISNGALLASQLKYGYGTYEWRMRLTSDATSPTGTGSCSADVVSGSVSAGFNFVNNSETEIDIEYSGHSPDLLYFANWNNTNPLMDPQPSQVTSTSLTARSVLGGGHSWCDDFRTYKFVWEPTRITFFVNDQLRAAHTTTLPYTAAYFMIVIRGTNDTSWGGTATIGTPRYLYVDWVRFTPPG